MTLSTIQILSTQYELSSKLSSNLDLDSLIQTFSRTIIRRFSLKNVHLYIHQKHLTLMEGIGNKCGHFRVISHCTMNVSNIFHDTITKLIDEATEINVMHLQASVASNNTSYIFGLEDVGFLVLETRGDLLDEMQVRSLESINTILAGHILGSFERVALRQSHDKIYQQLYFNQLTHLPNRNKFLKMFESWSGKTISNITFVLFNIKDFTLINHQFGHDKADILLKRIARQLQNEYRDQIIYHLGNDEFLLVLETTTPPPSIQKSDEKILKTKQNINDETMRVDNFSVDLWSTKIQFSRTSKDFLAEFSTLQFAMSLLRSKRTSLHSVIDAKTRQAFRKEHLIHQALANDIPFHQFKLVYQPQFDLTGQIISAEVLLRWKHPKIGYISPDIFIPILESGHKIIEVDSFVYSRALAALEDLRSLSDQTPKLAINVSGISLLDITFQQEIIDNIQSHNDIVLELTESAYINDRGPMFAAIEEMSKRGIKVHLDDFGTGYSSISYLMSLERRTTLKIDKSFIQSINTDKKKQRIVKSMINLARSCNHDVLAEGVETKLEFKKCVDLGISKFQGYYFSKPVDFSTYKKMITIQNTPNEIVDTSFANAG